MGLVRRRGVRAVTAIGKSQDAQPACPWLVRQSYLPRLVGPMSSVSLVAVHVGRGRGRQALSKRSPSHPLVCQDGRSGTCSGEAVSPLMHACSRIVSTYNDSTDVGMYTYIYLRRLHARHSHALIYIDLGGWRGTVASTCPQLLCGYRSPAQKSQTQSRAMSIYLPVRGIGAPA